MRMPGVDGAELLRRTVDLHPEVVRIVLSGQSDQEALLRAVGPAHQFLSKPCDPDVLVDTVRRAFALREIIRNPAVKRVASRFGALPSRPGVYADLLAELGKPEPSLTQVGALIGSDIGMSAKVLQLVNSPFFGLTSPTLSVNHATAMLGLETISALTLSTGAFIAFDDTRTDPGYVATWRRGVLVGGAALAIAGAEGLSEEARREALTAGLLHDVGRLILLSQLRSEYQNAVQRAAVRGTSTTESEYELMGTSHAEIGAYLLGIWGLPDPIVEAVALHHYPGRALSEAFTPLASVHAAAALVAERLDPHREGFLDTDYLRRIGAADRVPVWGPLVDHVVGTAADAREAG
jgi:HD-like signal output (HDOD) protein